ncbi:glycoside hydrolase family 16 protein [Marivirga sp.]|uniref:glycoside hydrolase family 16 protein n=1 Tax=Marivirga sp. TaxID=2018662 RepID=UPI002D7E4CAD|nr:glycoside hydrolase family 16 protein [Marivirga sp.]HET8859193.1 glycoside hydrolase family 16 protein [Marivirga sp.]
MKYIYAIGLLFIFIQCTQKDKNLIWSEEFEGNGLPSENRWTITEGNGCPELCGFGNNEAQFYTKSAENLIVEDGKLIITALKDEQKGFTSAKISTKNHGDWQYGYFEIRAKLPKGKGSWPAIWMLPTIDGKMQWPRDGEIDIMEYVGYNPGTVYGTIHTESYNHVKGTEKSDSIKLDDASEAFHIYAIHWTDQKIEWLVDGKPYHAVYKNGDGKAGWPFDNEFHLILNLAVGGNWGGKYGIDEESFPQKFVIDYVRVYSQKPDL